MVEPFARTGNAREQLVNTMKPQGRPMGPIATLWGTDRHGTDAAASLGPGPIRWAGIRSP